MFTRDYKELANGDYGQVMSTLGDELVVGSDVEIRLKYFAPGDGLKTGTMIRITLPPGFCPVQNIDIERPGFLLINGSFKHRLVLRKNLNFSVELEEDIQSGDAIEFVYNPKGRNMKPVATKVCYKDLVELDLDVKKQGDELYSRVFKKMIRLAPEKPAYIFIAIPSIVEEDERFDIHINVRDCYDNISTGFQGAIELYGNDQVLEYPRKITFYEQDRGNKVIEKACCFNIRVIPDSDEEMLLKQPKGYGVLSQPPEVENCQKISARYFDIFGDSNYAKLSKKGTPKIYWGDFHVHTRDLSDGMGTINDAFYYMKDVSGLNFGGISDHSFQGGHPFVPENLRHDIHISKEEWIDLINKCKDESKEGDFIAIPGYEWSGRLDNGELTKGFPGKAVSDKNIIFGNYDTQNPIVYQCLGTLKDKIGQGSKATIPEELYDKLKDYNYIAVPHSTSCGAMGTDFNYVEDINEPVVEIYSMHGASEYYGNPRPLYTTLREGFVQNALGLGKKIGFVAGGDDHHTHPGSKKVTAADYEPAAFLRYRPGITAIITSNLTLPNLFDGLRNRTCYATTGERILIQLEIDHKSCMGQELELHKAPVFHCLVAGTSKIEKIELIKNNQLLYYHPATYDVEKFSYKDDDFSLEKCFYYIRVTQSDGEMAWSSPVWF